MVKRAVIRTVRSLQQCLCWVSQFIASGLAGCKGLGCLRLRHCHTWVLAAGAQGAVRQALCAYSGSIGHSGGRGTKSRSGTAVWPRLGGSCRMTSPFAHSQDWRGTVPSVCSNNVRCSQRRTCQFFCLLSISLHSGQHLAMKWKM